MMIEFECGNFSGFDASKGKYIECGHKIIVSNEKIGEFVTCPKCQQQVEVPLATEFARRKTQLPSETSAAGPGGFGLKESKTSSNNSPADQQKKPKTAQAKSAKKSGSAAGDEIALAANDEELKLSDAFHRPKSDLGSISFAETKSEKRTLPKDQRKRCKKCGNLADEKGRCTSCGHAEPKFEKATQPLNEINVGLAGFQLWFCETMAVGVPIRVLEYGSHVSVVILAVLVSILALLGIGGVLGVVLLVIVGCGLALYIAMILKGHQLASKPTARLAWFQRPFWNLILFLARALKWQNYDERFKGRKIIDCRGEGITDERIPELDEVALCEVLDLEYTPVTDKGLRYLYGFQNLHCIVLRKTGVTHEGVFRLQQTHPKLWIWY